MCPYPCFGTTIPTSLNNCFTHVHRTVYLSLIITPHIILLSEIKVNNTVQKSIITTQPPSNTGQHWYDLGYVLLPEVFCSRLLECFVGTWDLQWNTWPLQVVQNVQPSVMEYQGDCHNRMGCSVVPLLDILLRSGDPFYRPHVEELISSCPNMMDCSSFLQSNT